MNPGFYTNSENQPCFQAPATLEQEAQMLADWNGTSMENELWSLEEAADRQAVQDEINEQYEEEDFRGYND